jgi:uncharacterized membrane protein (DUF485 family)
MSNPSPPPGDTGEHHSTITYNARLGLILFAIYCVIYAAFVGLCTFALDLMGQTQIGGVNLAVWYGFALIVFAFILAAIYLAKCRA